MIEAALPDDRPRILFVDDEQRVLDGLAASLRRMRRTWRMDFACGGAKALEQLAAARFDAIVTDMRMPGVDGEAVLSVARAHHPGAIRIVLSGQTDAAVVRRTMHVAHQFLSKPCNINELSSCLERLVGLSALLTNGALREHVCAMGYAAASSRSLERLQSLFRGGPVDPAAAVACIESDPALAAKVLHVASGGFFATRQSVATVRRAVGLIGMESVRTIALSTEVLSGVSSEQADEIVERARASGRLIAKMLGRDDANHYATVHAVGELVTLAWCGRLADPCGRAHGAAGAYLAGLWGMSPALVEALEVHSDPERVAEAGSEIAAALHGSCALIGGHGKLSDEVVNAYPAMARLAEFGGQA